jgi:hypothetical protein
MDHMIRGVIAGAAVGLALGGMSGVIKGLRNEEWGPDGPTSAEIAKLKKLGIEPSVAMIWEHRTWGGEEVVQSVMEYLMFFMDVAKRKEESFAGGYSKVATMVVLAKKIDQALRIFIMNIEKSEIVPSTMKKELLGETMTIHVTLEEFINQHR